MSFQCTYFLKKVIIKMHKSIDKLSNFSKLRLNFMESKITLICVSYSGILKLLTLFIILFIVYLVR